MKNLICVILLLFLSVSCNSNDKKITKVAHPKAITKTIEYDLSEEITSTEGAGAKADYVNGKIKRCITNIYGEMGQTEIIYLFKNDHINVTQEDYKYSTEGDSINTQKWTSEKLSYTIDLNGLLIKSAVDQEKIIDVFGEVQKSVPFELK